MKINQVPNFRVEDFPSEQSWIGRMFIQLNPLIQSINQILDENIDFSTNIKAVTRDYSITTFQPFNFTWGFPGFTPVDLRVIQANKGSTQTPTILQAAWSYNSTTQLISVTRMVEITESAVAQLSGSYQFKVRVTV